MSVLKKGDDRFPHMLMRTEASQHCPSVLYTEGNIDLLNSPCITIIGTRAATPLALRIAYSIAAHFASQGFTIVSGLAEGCDSAAHEGALSVGGRTIAVLGKPVWKPHWKEPNLALAKRIVDSGNLLVSEYNDEVYGKDAAAARFKKRDGIQAALSLAVMQIGRAHV